jgi:probable F420-dependent oxidoreductase
LVGADSLLAPEQTVVLEVDEKHRRRLARDFVARYLRLSNYRANLEREGWSGSDLGDDGSEALVDALVLQGDPGVIATGIRAHLNAGADHVAVQVLGDAKADGFRVLAEALS